MATPEASTNSHGEAGDRLLVLASQAAVRAAMLRAAGLSFTVQPARVDEGAVKEAMRAEDPEGRETARTLASLKARRVSTGAPGAFVIGADQLLVCGNEWFDKPVDVEDAKGQLKRLRGRRHTLVTAVSVVRDEAEIWGHLTCPELTMRSFSDDFIQRYVERAGDGILACVGGYEAEGLGAQLLAEIEGDWFAVLGLPLLPLLDFLRGHGLVET
ncbi:MAG: Maf family protein [Rhodospirillaceae bacterium]|nr:Maf family protein [Rhodospirillaceae bacterium]